MTEKDQIHTLLADLASEDPPVDIDLDHQIYLGRRRTRRRTAALCVTAVAVPAVLLGGILTLRPDSTGSVAPAASTNPSPPLVTLPDGTVVTLPDNTTRRPNSTAVTNQSTQKSRALRAQVLELIPEIADTPGGRIFDMADPMDSIHAGADWIWEKQSNQVTISVVVGRRGAVPPTCDGKTGPNRCTEIRRLPDGSTAYLHTYLVGTTQGHSYDVTLDRPDGTSISVSSSAWKPKGAKHDAPLSLERVLQIAQKITVKP